MMIIKESSSYDDRAKELNTTIAIHRSHTSKIIKLLNDELAQVLSSHKKIEAQYTVSQLTLFEQKVVRPYFDMYLVQYGVSNPDAIKKLQSLKEKIMSEKYRLENYLFSKKITTVIYSKSVSRIEVKLKDLEELIWENDSLTSRKFVLEQAEKCIKALPSDQRSGRIDAFKKVLPLDQQSQRVNKFKMVTPQL